MGRSSVLLAQRRDTMEFLRAQLLWAIWCQRVAHSFQEEQFHLGIVLWQAWRNTIYSTMEAYIELFRHKQNEEKRQEMITCFQTIWTAAGVFGRLGNDGIQWNLTPHSEFLPRDLGARMAQPIKVHCLSPSPDIEANFAARQDLPDMNSSTTLATTGFHLRLARGGKTHKQRTWILTTHLLRNKHRPIRSHRPNYGQDKQGSRKTQQETSHNQPQQEKTSYPGRLLHPQQEYPLQKSKSIQARHRTTLFRTGAEKNKNVCLDLVDPGTSNHSLRRLNQRRLTISSEKLIS